MRELADFENLLEIFEVTPQMLEREVFGDRPSVEMLVVLLDEIISGYALYFQNFSSFLGKPGIYLEDIYVRQSERGKGLGKALLQEVIRIAHERECGRCEWVVLDWNRSAREFYESLGANPLNDWTVYRLDADGIAAALDRM